MGGLRVATSCLNLSQHSLPHSPSERRSLSEGLGFLRNGDRSGVFGYSSRIYRSRSCEMGNFRGRSSRRGCCASMEAFSDEEFSKKIQELALRFQVADGDGSISIGVSESCFESEGNLNRNQSAFYMSRLEPVEPPDWQDVISGSIERKANSVDLPFSLRMIRKKKKQLKQGFVEVGESACSSVKKAFSSMVFIIGELQSYTLQMREVLFYEDLQGILVRVHKEMNDSFVWLFQQVFSHTPTLMLYVMILLANYSVHSMATNSAVSAPPPLSYTTESVSDISNWNDVDQKFDSSSIKTFSVSSSSGKMTSIGGNNGGGGKFPPIASGTNGDECFDASASSDYHRTDVPDGPSTTGRSGEQESVLGLVSGEELSLWNSVVQEASSMQAVLRDECLDHETMQRFVSPVTAKIESDDYADYLRTELLYQTELLQEPSNTLLLANYAQFLYLVAQDYDRAEDYFKRAANVEPKDAEAVSKYASFLWQARKDLWAAEETYLEAISIDPSNSYYAANYAHFLWSTGGEDTCFPLSSSDTNSV